MVAPILQIILPIIKSTMGIDVCKFESMKEIYSSIPDVNIKKGIPINTDITIGKNNQCLHLCGMSSIIVITNQAEPTIAKKPTKKLLANNKVDTKLPIHSS